MRLILLIPLGIDGYSSVIKFKLEDALLTYFNEFAELKLFMTVTYDNETETLPLYERLYLDIEAPLQKIPEIYVRLLNFQVPTDIEMNLRKVAGSIQHIKGNDHIMSESKYGLFFCEN